MRVSSHLGKLMAGILVALAGCVVSLGDDLQEGHILAIEGRKVPVGEKIRKETIAELKNASFKYTENGKWQSGKRAESTRMVSLMEKKSPDSWVLEYLESKRRRSTLFRGSRTKRSYSGPLHGAMVQIDRNGEGWKAKILKRGNEDVDREGERKRLESLESSVYKDHGESLYGFEPRKVGQSWEVENPRLPGFRSAELIKGKASVTFEKVEEFQGEECAILKVSYELTVDFSGKGISINHYSGQGTIKRSLRLFRDLEFEAEGTKSNQLKLEGGGVVETKGKSRLIRKIQVIPNEDSE